MPLTIGRSWPSKQFPSLLATHREFITRQHIFFTATAATEGRVNVSPRPTDAFRVIPGDPGGLDDTCKASVQ